MFQALALQCPCNAVNKESDAKSAKNKMLASIASIDKQITATKRFLGPKLKLVVCPEYFLSGFPAGEAVSKWQEFACLDPIGKEYEAMQKLASKNGVYFSGNCYEVDSNFPDIFFQVSFIIDDKGEVVLKYRRLISTYSPTPHDVLDRYLEIYGEDSLFPVADTSIGRLACVASEEILFPEISRALALKGAEIICHSSSEVGSTLDTPKHIAKLARAYENHVYIISANSAGILDTDFPVNSTDGNSVIIDFLGKIIAQSETGETMAANGYISLENLREYRSQPGMFNIFTRQRLELFKKVYSGSVYPANTLSNKKEITPAHYRDCHQKAIDRLLLSNLGNRNKSD